MSAVRYSAVSIAAKLAIPVLLLLGLSIKWASLLVAIPIVALCVAVFARTRREQYIEPYAEQAARLRATDREDHTVYLA